MSQRMKALVLRDRQLLLEDHPKPGPRPGEAVLRVLKAGICNTDLELLRGYKGSQTPLVLGHEFVGVIDGLPNDARDESGGLWRIGERVVAEINTVGQNSSSTTWQARAQDPARAALGIFGRDGAFAEFVRVPLTNLHRVPDGLSDDQAVFTEPLAAACQVLEQLRFTPSTRVVVLGDGKLGLLCAQVVASTGCEAIALGRHESKLAILSRRGIRTMLASAWDLGPWADVVIECTGSSAGFGLAQTMLRPHGTLVLKSTYAGGGVNLSRVVVDEITVLGSRCGPFGKALQMLEQQCVDVTSLIDARFGLHDGLRAFERAQERGSLKVLLEM